MLNSAGKYKLLYITHSFASIAFVFSVKFYENIQNRISKSVCRHVQYIYLDCAYFLRRILQNDLTLHLNTARKQLQNLRQILHLISKHM